MRGSPLARTLLAVYLVLVAYASLHPFSGWRDQGLSPFAFLGAAWPRYVTGFDLAANVIAYVPVGGLAVLALLPRLHGAAAVLCAVGGATMFSIAVEALQAYLPSRIPSNVDLACNAAGAAIGGLAALAAGRWLLETGPLRRAREALVAPGAFADAGLVLIGLWLFVQLDPTSLVFGAGDLRALFDIVPGRERRPGYFVAVEAAIAGANLVAVVLVASAVLREGTRVRLLLAGLVVAALVVRTAAFVILLRAENVFAWLTPGATQGLVAGAVLAAAALALPPMARLVFAAVLLMAATALVNLAPTNPYTAATLKVWSQGHFLNFNGLTRLASAAWPFAALAYAVALAARGGRAGVG